MTGTERLQISACLITYCIAFAADSDQFLSSLTRIVMPPAVMAKVLLWKAYGGPDLT